MKISIVNVQVPFVRDRTDELADSLAGKITERGHRVEIVRIPFQAHPPQAVEQQILACKMLNLYTGGSDLVLALRFPAYLIPFANKKIWMTAQVPGVHEYWASAHDSEDGDSDSVRSLMVAADQHSLPQAKKLFANSRTIAERLKRFNNIETDEVLYTPLRRPELYRCQEADSYFFCPCQIDVPHRQILAVEAMRFVKSSFRLALVGNSHGGEYQKELESLIRQYRLEEKIEFFIDISESERARHMSKAYAALCISNEDVCDTGVLEALHSSKPVITCNDSRSITELIVHEHNGLVVAPTPEALGQEMEHLWANNRDVHEMGRAAFETPEKHHITWDYVLDKLLA